MRAVARTRISSHRFAYEFKIDIIPISTLINISDRANARRIFRRYVNRRLSLRRITNITFLSIVVLSNTPFRKRQSLSILDWENTIITINYRSL